MQELNALYDIVKERKNSPMEGSYTCYLFEQGLDKILKKNKDAEPLCGEICDLLYHLIVLLVQAELPLEQVCQELALRAQKIGNLKKMKKVDHNT